MGIITELSEGYQNSKSITYELSTMLYYLWLRPNCCPLREERAAAKYKLKGKSELEGQVLFFSTILLSK